MSFNIETNAFRHGTLIKNPRVLYTMLDQSGKQYPMQYGSNESPTKDHVDWLHMQVTGLSLIDQDKPEAPEIIIIVEFFDHKQRYTKLTFRGKPGNWTLLKREAA